MDIKKLPKTEFAAAVAQIAGERNIEAQYIIESIETGLISAYKRDQKERGVVISEDDVFEVELAAESGAFVIYKVEDDKRVEVTPPGFGRIAAQTAKQVIDQKIREAEKEAIIADFRKKVGGLVMGTVLKVDPYRMTIGISGAVRAEGICPKDEQIRGEELVAGTRKLFLLKDIYKDELGRSDIILSRRDPQFVAQLFAKEVPEVSTRVVVIEKIARSAGERTKVAVSSSQKGVDPVGSCIGQKGTRIQAVLSELPASEKLDVVLFSKNLDQFAVSALSPATGAKVVESKGEALVIEVPEDQLALAIGSGGDNVRLAGMLVDREIKVGAAKS